MALQTQSDPTRSMVAPGNVGKLAAEWKESRYDATAQRNVDALK
jgi:hypothetical protein